MNNLINSTKSTWIANVTDVEGLEKYYKSKTPRFDKITEEFEECLDNAKFVKCYDLNCVSCKEFYFRGYIIHIKELEQTYSAYRYFSLQVIPTEEECEKYPYINDRDEIVELPDERYREFSDEKYLSFMTSDNLNTKTMVRRMTIRKYLTDVMSRFVFEIKAAINNDEVDETIEVLESEEEI